VKLPSFSKLELASLCQYPWTSGIRYKETYGKAAAFGKAAHKMAECIAVWGDAPVGDIADEQQLDQEHHEQLINAYVELTDRLTYEAQHDHWRITEWCFGLQLHTGLVRPIDFNRRWRRRNNEVVGVIDLLREDEEHRLRVRDYKSGYGARYLTPMDSLQLLCYGLAAARYFKRETVIVELCAIGTELWIESQEQDEFLLDWAWEELHRVQALAQDHANNIPKPGAHCRELFCPIVDKCPATQKSLAAIDAATEIKMPLVCEIESDEHALYIYERLPAIKAALKKVESALRERFRDSELTLSNGKKLTHWDVTRERVAVTDATIGILDKHLNGQGGDLVEQKISNTAIRALCKDVAPDRGASALYRTVWADLERAGLVNTSTHQKFEARKVKKDDA
jgi:hypothetical protein